MDIKVVGKSGQISVGKAMAGMSFIMQALPEGDILLKHAVVVPTNERWLHEPGVQTRLAQADAWMRKNPVRASDLDALEAQALGQTPTQSATKSLRKSNQQPGAFA
jgi:hypothetical protein